MTYDEIADCFQEAEDTDDLGDCRKLAEQSGLDHMASGGRREVFADDGQVVKFAYDPGIRRDLPEGVRIGNTGRGEIEAEVEAWENAPPELRDDIVPIENHDEDHRWIVTPKVETESSTCDRKAIARDVRQNDWVCKDLIDENVGQMDGDPVLLDYGDCAPGDPESPGVVERAHQFFCDVTR